MKIHLDKDEIESAILNYVKEKVAGLPQYASVEIGDEHYGNVENIYAVVHVPKEVIHTPMEE